MTILVLAYGKNEKRKMQGKSVNVKREYVIVGLGEMTADAVKASRQLRVIARHGVGVDTVDVEAATKRGIIVSNALGANENAVADMVFGLI